jgi:hypothetical protein
MPPAAAANALDFRVFFSIVSAAVAATSRGWVLSAVNVRGRELEFRG